MTQEHTQETDSLGQPVPDRPERDISAENESTQETVDALKEKIRQRREEGQLKFALGAIALILALASPDPGCGRRDDSGNDKCLFSTQLVKS